MGFVRKKMGNESPVQWAASWSQGQSSSDPTQHLEIEIMSQLKTGSYRDMKLGCAALLPAIWYLAMP